MPPTDYSAHLIAARKALATAEAHAALHQWWQASDWFLIAKKACSDAEECAWQQHKLSLDTPPQSGADKL